MTVDRDDQGDGTATTNTGQELPVHAGTANLRPFVAGDGEPSRWANGAPKCAEPNVTHSEPTAWP